MRRVRTSLTDAQLANYVVRQLNGIFPDERPIALDALHTVLPTTLDRIEHCFTKISNKYFFDGSQAVFSHLHGDQYAMFLYLLANTAHRAGLSDEVATKVDLLNKALDGKDAFYEVELLFILLFVDRIVTVLVGMHSDHLVVYQCCGSREAKTTKSIENEASLDQCNREVLCSEIVVSVELYDCDGVGLSWIGTCVMTWSIGNLKILHDLMNREVRLAAWRATECTAMTKSFECPTSSSHTGGAGTYPRGANQFPFTAPQNPGARQRRLRLRRTWPRYLDDRTALRAVNIGYAEEEIDEADLVKSGTADLTPAVADRVAGRRAVHA